MNNQKNDALGNNKYFLKTSYQKSHSKIHLHEKVFWGKKDVQSFLKVILLTPNYRF